jgi:hypothetical protein
MCPDLADSGKAASDQRAGEADIHGRQTLGRCRPRLCENSGDLSAAPILIDFCPFSSTRSPVITKDYSARGRFREIAEFSHRLDPLRMFVALSQPAWIGRLPSGSSSK